MIDPLTVQLHGPAIAIPSVGETISNGFISIRPFTALQSPDLSDVYFNVYVSAEDFQVNIPIGDNFPTERRILSESKNFGSSPEVGYTCFDLNEVSDTADGCTELCFGEQPLSLRTVLKRYQYVDSASHALVGARKSTLFTRNNFPSITQFNLSGASFSMTNLFQYLQYAYLGYKGSIRYRIHPWLAGSGQQSGQSTTVTFGAVTNSLTESGPTAVSTGATVNVIGGAIFDQHTNGGVEVELPYFSPNLFSFSFSLIPTGALTNGMMNEEWVKQHKIWVDNATTSVDMVLTREMAVGEDFQFLRFNGAPYYTKFSA